MIFFKKNYLFFLRSEKSVKTIYKGIFRGDSNAVNRKQNGEGSGEAAARE